MLSHLRSVFAVLAVGTLLSAQNTIIVDAAGGGDFTDIPPAIAAAVDGDVILVRGGTYSLFTVDGKAISIVGTAGVVVGDLGTFAQVLVRNAPAGRDVVLADFEVVTFGGLARLELSNCAGRVLVERVRLPAVTLNSQAMQITDCAQVLVTSCPAESVVACTRSHVAFTDCTVFATSTILPALIVTGGSALVSRSTFVAANGVFFPAPSGIRLADASLRITDDGTGVVVAGTSLQANPMASAIDGTGSVTIDPNVVLQPNNAPAIAATLSVQNADLPALIARGAPLGGMSSVELFSRPGENYFLLWSDAGDALPFPILGGDLWLDPATVVLARAGVLDMSGRTRFDFSVPRLPGLVGAPFHWQGVAGGPMNLRLSNPGGYTHAP